MWRFIFWPALVITVGCRKLKALEMCGPFMLPLQTLNTGKRKQLQHLHMVSLATNLLDTFRELSTTLNRINNSSESAKIVALTHKGAPRLAT